MIDKYHLLGRFYGATPMCIRLAVFLDVAVVRRWCRPSDKFQSLNEEGATEMQQERLNLYLPKQVSDSLKALSQKDGRTVPELARAAIIEFVAKHKQ